MAVKEKLIQLVEGLECSTKNVQNKLDAASTMLKETSTKIPENQIGKYQVYRFLQILFTSYPQTMTDVNYQKLETFVERMEKTIKAAPSAGKRGR